MKTRLSLTAAAAPLLPRILPASLPPEGCLLPGACPAFSRHTQTLAQPLLPSQETLETKWTRCLASFTPPKAGVRPKVPEAQDLPSRLTHAPQPPCPRYAGQPSKLLGAASLILSLGSLPRLLFSQGKLRQHLLESPPEPSPLLYYRPPLYLPPAWPRSETPCVLRASSQVCQFLGTGTMSARRVRSPGPGTQWV